MFKFVLGFISGVLLCNNCSCDVSPQEPPQIEENEREENIDHQYDMSMFI